MVTQQKLAAMCPVCSVVQEANQADGQWQFWYLDSEGKGKHQRHGRHSMSMTLDSFCKRFNKRSPDLIVCWYCAFFVSGLQQQSPNVTWVAEHGKCEHVSICMTHGKFADVSKPFCGRAPETTVHENQDTRLVPKSLARMWTSLWCLLSAVQMFKTHSTV